MGSRRQIVVRSEEVPLGQHPEHTATRLAFSLHPPRHFQNILVLPVLINRIFKPCKISYLTDMFKETIEHMFTTICH